MGNRIAPIHRRVSKSLIVGLVLLVSACGGGASDDDATETGTDEAVAAESNDDGGGETAAGSGDVVDPQPAGQAMASVDGLEFSFDTAGPSDCIIEPDTLTFAFVIGDNEVTLGGGSNLYDDGWLGNLLLRVLNEDGQIVQYYPDDGAMDGGVAIDGDSMSFSGPMLMKPPNDGSNPPAEPVGDGTISVTCG